MTTVFLENRSHTRCGLGIWLLAAICIWGCGPNRSYEIVPVSGTVKLDGRPLAQARVIFQPMKQPGTKGEVGPGSYGKTDDQGRFTLETVDRLDGAVVGPHMVRITTLEVTAVSPGSDISRTTQREVIPPKYRNGFQMEVTSATDAFEIDLASK